MSVYIGIKGVNWRINNGKLLSYNAKKFQKKKTTTKMLTLLIVTLACFYDSTIACKKKNSLQTFACKPVDIQSLCSKKKTKKNYARINMSFRKGHELYI